MTALWIRFGDLPGWAVVATVLAVVWLGRVAAGEVPAGPVVAAVAGLVAYCCARPHHGLDVFFLAAVPGLVGSVLHDVFDVSQAWGLVLVPVALHAIWKLDRDHEPGAAKRPEAVAES